jgi:hypothetical protein
MAISRGGITCNLVTPRARIIHQYNLCNPFHFFNTLQHHEANKAVRASYEHTLHPPGILNGYTFDKQLSGKRAKVFVHKDKQNVILAHKDGQTSGQYSSSHWRKAEAEQMLPSYASSHRLRAS